MEGLAVLWCVVGSYKNLGHPSMQAAVQLLCWLAGASTAMCWSLLPRMILLWAPMHPVTGQAVH